jgi:hypothetical protein
MPYTVGVLTKRDDGRRPPVVSIVQAQIDPLGVL